MSERFSVVSEGFAEALAAQWGREPRVFRDVLSGPVFSEDELMAGLLGTAADYAANTGAAVPPGRLFVNGVSVTPDRLAPFLPRGLEESCQDYVGRIRRDHPGDEISIVLDGCERHMPGTRERLVPVLHRLFSRVGYPARHNHTCIYAGTYRTTPFGIHRDDCHVLMFCGVGRKRMAFWPRPHFERRQDLVVRGKVCAPVRDHLAEATVLEIGPHDVMYWSPDQWHVAISDSEAFHASLSVGLYHDGSSGEEILRLAFLKAIARTDDLDIRGLPPAPDGRISASDLATGSMAPFFERWNRLRDELSRPGEAESRALAIALRLVSSAGYGRLLVPSLAAPVMLADAVLECPVPGALVVARTRDGLMVGANGRVFFYERTADTIEHVVTTLRRDRSCRLANLVSSSAEAARPFVADSVRNFAAAGAIRLRPGVVRPPAEG